MSSLQSFLSSSQENEHLSYKFDPGACLIQKPLGQTVIKAVGIHSLFSGQRLYGTYLMPRLNPGEAQ